MTVIDPRSFGSPYKNPVYGLDQFGLPPPFEALAQQYAAQGQQQAAQQQAQQQAQNRPPISLPQLQGLPPPPQGMPTDLRSSVLGPLMQQNYGLPFVNPYQKGGPPGLGMPIQQPSAGAGPVGLGTPGYGATGGLGVPGPSFNGLPMPTGIDLPGGPMSIPLPNSPLAGAPVSMGGPIGMNQTVANQAALSAAMRARTDQAANASDASMLGFSLRPGLMNSMATPMAMASQRMK